MQSKKATDEMIRTSRVLIVDDTPTNRKMIRNFCRNAGFGLLDEAENGQEALEKIIRWKPDLIFLDMQMPIMSGLDLCHQLRQLNMLDDMVIIMQTVEPNLEFKVQAFEAGITDLIEKPLDPHLTMARALAHLERRYLKKKSDLDYRRIQSELREAVMLQNILLPDEKILQSIRNTCGLDVAHYYHPASELAGDYLSVRALGNNKVALISVDISGHGVTAALYAFSIHTLLMDEMLSTHSPGNVLQYLNEKLHAFMSTGKFATIFLAIIDSEKHLLSYAAAAAPPPILFLAGKPVMLETRGHPLGIDDKSQYETHSIPYTPGDMLFTYSDALVETLNEEGQRMTEADLTHRLETNLTSDAVAINKAVLMAFYGKYSRQPEDDLSMLTCKF